MCKVKNGSQYDEEAREEMSVLEDRGGIKERRAKRPGEWNGSRFVTLVRFYTTIGSMAALGIGIAYPFVRETGEMRGKVQQMPSHAEMLEVFMPREASELRFDALDETSKEILKEQREINQRLRDFELWYIGSRDE